MSDPRVEDLHVTYDDVESTLEELGEVERRKQATRPGTPGHHELAVRAREKARRLAASTAAEAALAGDLADDPPAEH